MTFETFGKLTNATLLNNPSISSFEKVELDAKKVKRGDLFIGDLTEDIELAVSLEAYGIVSKSTYAITDSEIAWFKADHLDDVLIRLLRFSLLEKNLRFIYAINQEIELIKKIANKELLIFLDKDEKHNYKQIINAQDNNIVFSSDKEFLRQISPDFEEIHNNTKLNIIKHTLFLTNFVHEDRAYVDIKIPFIFIHSLENILSFLKDKKINFEIEKSTYTSHFHPIFVDKNLNIKHFGKSERVIICEPDCKMIDYELSYLKEHAAWAKIIQITDLYKLKTIDFNFAIINQTYEKTLDKLGKKDEQTLLF